MKKLNQKNMWIFLASVFMATWLLWIPLVFLNLDKSLFTLLVLLGAFMPSIIGVIMIYITQDKEGIKSFWKRVRSFSQIKIKWLIFIILIFPILMITTYQICRFTGINTPFINSMIEIITSPLSLLSFIVIMLLGGPLAEELGWRGFLLDYLQLKLNALNASLLLGAIWALWHLPLFFIPGTTQEVMVIGSLHFWSWVFQVIAKSVIYTTVYNNTGRSILTAIIVHFMSNSVTTIIVGIGGSALPVSMEVIHGILVILTAAILVMIWKPKRLSRHNK